MGFRELCQEVFVAVLQSAHVLGKPPLRKYEEHVQAAGGANE